MGLRYDDTPSAEWMSAKVYAEYAVRQVNDYVRREIRHEIPMAIARSFARNLDRAVAALPANYTSSQPVMSAKERLVSSLIPLKSVARLKNCRLDGDVGIDVLAKALSDCRDVFAHAYASVMNKHHMEVLDYGETTDKGVVERWDREKYGSPEEDPDAVITEWAVIEKDVYKETYDAGWTYWELNETQVFANLYFEGCYAGHIDGHDVDAPKHSVTTECALLGAGRNAGRRNAE